LEQESKEEIMKALKLMLIIFIVLCSLNLTGYNINNNRQTSHHNMNNINNDILNKRSLSTNYINTKTEKFKQTIDIYDDTAINVHNINGSIKITGWDKNYLEIYAIKKTNRSFCELKKVLIDVNVEQGLTINTRNNSDDPEVVVNYVIKVPDKVYIGDVTTDDGKIIIKNVAGSLTTYKIK